MQISEKKARDAVAKVVDSDEMLCIILSYNGCEDTLRCIETLRASSCKGMQLLVIDNASAPGVVERLEAEFPDVELVTLSENLGWAGGNNFGIKIALERGYKWICLMNNDLEFPPSEPQKWMDAIADMPPCLMHPTIYYWDDPEVAQVDPRVHAVEQSATEPAKWHGKTRLNHAYGACLAVHADVFRAVGLFDERLFLQLEETDFHYRAQQHGFPSVCDTNVKVLHKESRAFGGTRAPIKLYYTVRNSLLFIEKKSEPLRQRLHSYKSLYWTVRNVASHDLGDPSMNMIAFIKWLLSASGRPVAVRLGFRDYIFREFGKISLLHHSEIRASEAADPLKLQQLLR